MQKKPNWFSWETSQFQTGIPETSCAALSKFLGLLLSRGLQLCFWLVWGCSTQNSQLLLWVWALKEKKSITDVSLCFSCLISVLYGFIFFFLLLYPFCVWCCAFGIWPCQTLWRMFVNFSKLVVIRSWMVKHETRWRSSVRDAASALAESLAADEGSRRRENSCFS